MLFETLQTLCMSFRFIDESSVIKLITHALGGAADGGVAVSGSLLVSLDLLADLSLNLVRAAGHQVFSFQPQAGQTLLKTGDLLHHRLKPRGQVS